MTKYSSPVVSVAAAAMMLLAQVAIAQTHAKPSAYEGLSQPPTGDAIVTTPDTPEPTLQVRPAVIPAPAAVTVTPPLPPASAHTVVPAFNPDGGIVGDTPVRPVASVAPGSNLEPTLYERSVNPDAGLVHVEPQHPGELETGTLIRVRIQGALSSSKNAPGDPFSAVVMAPVEQSGKVIIPMGAEVKGRIVSVHEGKAMRGRATMRLRPDLVTMPDGSRYMLHAQVVQTQGTDTKADREGSVTTKSHVKKDAVEFGIAAGSGAVLGAQIAGGTGALVGSAVGAGLVTVHLLVQNHQAQLPKDSVLIFGLTEPMLFTAVQN